MSLTENQAVMELLIFLFSTFLVSARSDMAERNAYLSDLLTDNRIKQEGDLMLGGIFSVNTTQDESGFDFPSLLQAQAMIYQVDKINMNQNILPDYTLGYEMMDDCYRVDLAVKAATMFMMGETALDRRRWIVEYRKKRMEMAKGEKRAVMKMKSPKMAIIGPSNSDLSIAIASMASVNFIPIISYSATSIELSQKKKYPSFLRTVPSDLLQVSAMADVIRHFNWTWISAVGTDDTYGQFGVVALKEELLNRNICLAKELLIDYRMTKESILSTLNELFNDTKSQRAEVIVFICPGAKVHKFLQVVKEQGVFNKTWIASESWGYRELPLDLRDVVGGALGLVVDNPKPQHFIQYVNKLTVGEVRTKNPWFYSYLRRLRVINNTNPDLENRTLSEIGFKIDQVWYSTVTPVMDAVKATALALHQLLYEKNKTLSSIYPIDLLKALRRGNFPSSVDPSVHFKFDKDGDVSRGYRITNLRSVIDGSGKHTLRFDTVGKWINFDCETCECDMSTRTGLSPSHDGNYSQGYLCLEDDQIVWPSRSSIPPESTCQKECLPGYYKIWGGSRCCWSCNACPANYYSNVSGTTCCKRCPRDMINNPGHTGCIYESDYANWKSVGELVALGVAALGLGVDLLVASILFMYRKTPVVICSNAPLTFILLYLLANAFVLPLLYVFRPTSTFCIAENILFGWTFSTITGIFFTKTYHVLQIFTAKLSHTLHLLSQRGLQRREIWLSLGLGAAVLVPTVPYLIVHEPVPVANDSGDCGTNWVNVQLMNMAYIALLSLATTFVSFRARNLPENYNEAHTVATTMLMLMLVWVSSLPSYYRVTMANRALILGLAVDAAAFCILVVVFGPKLYLIFVEPHKNTPLYVSRMNMIHLWKQQSKKRVSSTSSRRTDNSGDNVPGQSSGSSPARKRSRIGTDRMMAMAKRSTRVSSASTSSVGSASSG